MPKWCSAHLSRKDTVWLPKPGRMAVSPVPNILVRSRCGNWPAARKTVRLLLQKAVVGADDRIAYNASLRIKKGSSLSVSGVRAPNFRGISSPDFRVIYGLIDDNFTAGQVDIATEGLDDLFDGDDNVLSFADPRIRLTAQSNIGIPLRASFAMTSVNDRSGATESVTVDRITMNAPALTDKPPSAISGSALPTVTFRRNIRLRHVRSTI